MLANPLDYSDTFLKDAIHLTYLGSSAKNQIPTLDDISEYLPAHFRQELSLYITVTEQFDMVGVESTEELIESICDGEFDRFVPDQSSLKRYLNDMNVSYLEKGQLRNHSVVKVW